MKLPMQIADVTKALGSADQMIEAGNTVVFDKNGSYIQNKVTGKKTALKRKNGSFVFSLWVKRKGASGFTGQAMSVEVALSQETF